MIVEMRTYTTEPGKRAQFLDVFRSRSIPAHIEIGMKILGPFCCIDKPDKFFFMRGFPDLSSREPLKAKFYEGELWKHELEHILMPMLDKYEVVLVDDPENQIHWRWVSFAAHENLNSKHRADGSERLSLLQAKIESALEPRDAGSLDRLDLGVAGGWIHP